MRAKFVNEKFTEDDSDPIKDMGIGAKIVYYYFSKALGVSLSEYFYMYLSGNTFNIKNIIKNYGFHWNRDSFAWESMSIKTRQTWMEFCPKLFKEIEQVPGYIIKPKGPIDEKSILIPGYNVEEYPSIEDGQGDKVYIKQWSHHFPVVGLVGKGTFKVRNLLRYFNFDFNRANHMWEKNYKKEEIDTLINILKQNNFQIIDQRKNI